MRETKEHEILAGDSIKMGPYRFTVSSIIYEEFIDKKTQTEGARMTITVDPCVINPNEGGA